MPVPETVPIVTEVTKAQLDALVAANGLNEGLQYKVTDKGWLLLATSANTYIYSGSLPYKIYTCLMNQSLTDAPIPTVLQNTIGEIIWNREESGIYHGILANAFIDGKTVCMQNQKIYVNDNDAKIYIRSLRESDNSISLVTCDFTTTDPQDGKLTDLYIEIRVYF